MNAREFLQKGDIDSALSSLEGEIRKDPSNAKHRIFLFQLASVNGEWNRGLTQLNVISDLDPKTLPMVNTYKDVLQCEGFRARVFSGDMSPLVFGEPKEWLALMIEGVRLVYEDKNEEAEEIVDRVFSEAPAVSGVIDGESFAWLSDADTRLGPVFEVIMKGRYYWIPVDMIKQVIIEKPVDLRDLVWIPASFTWKNGGEEVGFIPSRYPASHESSDPLIRLSRKTGWLKKRENIYIGEGQRVINTDSAEYSLLDIRRIEFNDER